MNDYLLRHLRHNTVVNLLDGAFFGLGTGFASFVTIFPLFVSTMTDSPILIGLVPAIHSAGWQLPQAFTASWIARRRCITPLVIRLFSLERLPYLGFTLLALFLHRLTPQIGLFFAFGLLIVQGLGAGLSANPWQSLIAKVIPGDRRGTFLGLQAGLQYLLAGISAVFAGQILERSQNSSGYTTLFFLAAIAMGISWFFVALTREPNDTSLYSPEVTPIFINPRMVMQRMIHCSNHHDRNFLWFLIARMVSQFALVGYAFFSIFAVKYHGVSEIEIGYMTGILMGALVIANVGMGWIGDRYSHRRVIKYGLIAMTISSALAWWAPSSAWFYLIYPIAAIGYVAIWTNGMSMTLEFGDEAQRPSYIGLANTLIAPANILAPFIGGWVAAFYGYPTAFILSAAGGILGALMFHFLVSNPSPVENCVFSTKDVMDAA